MVILRICVATSCMSFGGGEGGIWLDGFPGLNPGLLCRERLQLTQLGGLLWETSVTGGGGCTGRASRVAEKCWAQFAVSSWLSFCWFLE